MPLQPLFYSARLLRQVLPLVDQELAYWEAKAAAIPCEALRRQALASLRQKRFHAQGGCIFAVAPRVNRARMVSLIVALQSISDYLDNLGDRTGSLNEQDFRALHQALLDATSPYPPIGGYYRHHPHQDDGGYLEALVARCREEIYALPGFETIEAEVRRQLVRYCDLQVYKHLPEHERERRLLEWHAVHPDRVPELEWWEFAAAAGSTLGVFALFALANRLVDHAEVCATANAYFPWVSGLHILLDYLIDQAEDAVEGDLNFAAYYASLDVATARICALSDAAVRAVGCLPARGFHVTVIEGLLAMYLSDAKVQEQAMEGAARTILAARGVRAEWLHRICQRWRLQEGASSAGT